LQLGIEALIATGPINIGVRLGKEEGYEGREIAVEHLFPGAVIIRHHHKSWEGMEST
jgi:hypothetical protein